MEDVIRYRLRMSEIVPVEMAHFRIGTFFSPSRPTHTDNVLSPKLMVGYILPLPSCSKRHSVCGVLK